MTTESVSSPVSNVDPKSIVDRCKQMLLDPKGTWVVIKAESKSIKDIYSSFLIPVAAVSAICPVIGGVVFGKLPLISGLISHFVSFVIGLVMTYVMGMVVKTLAPRFGGNATDVDAFKLMAYTSSVNLVGSMLGIVPPLMLLGILFSLYSIYVLWVGITPMVGVPEGRRIPFIVVIAVIVLVISFFVGLLMAPLMIGAAIAGGSIGQ